MPFVHKTKADVAFPAAGQVLSLGPAKAYADIIIDEGSRLFLFREDKRPRDGGLVARGTVVKATQVSNRFWEITAQFNGEQPIIHLPNHALDKFCKNGTDDKGPFQLPLMTEIAELRRNTTHQPVHAISDASADWLDLYHF